MASTCVATPFGGQLLMSPQQAPLAEPKTGSSYCQGVAFPDSLGTGGFATHGFGAPYSPCPPFEHYAGFDYSAISAERKRPRETGRRPSPKKRVLDQAPTTEQENPEPVSKKARTAPPADGAKPGTTSQVAMRPSAATYQAVSSIALGPLVRHITSNLRASAMATGARSAASAHRSGGASPVTTKTPAARKTRATPRATPSPSPARPGQTSKKGGPAKTSPVSQGALAKDAPAKGKPDPVPLPTSPCPQLVTPKQANKRSRAASSIAPLQDPRAKENLCQGRPSHVTSTTLPCPPSATPEQVFKIRRTASLRSPFQDHVAQEGEPEPAASYPTSTMAILDEGLQAAGSSCADTAASPGAASAVTAAGQGLQNSPKLTASTGNGSVSCQHSTVGILEPGLPGARSSCPDTATFPGTATAAPAASQGLQEDPEEMDWDGSEEAVSQKAMMERCASCQSTSGS